MTRPRKPKISPKDDLDEVLRLAAGRRFIKRLLDESMVFTDPFAKDPILTARNTGLRAQGLALWHEIMKDHTELGFILLREDANAQQEAADEAATLQDT